MTPHVVATSANPVHGFSKLTATRITLLAGLGVEGDAHCGTTVRHRSRVARDPTQPNLRQVHLIQAELFDDLIARGFRLEPGRIGENITTRHLDLLALPADTELLIGATAVVRITGLRNPCDQLNRYQPGLMVAVLDRGADGTLIRKAGVMGVVLSSGEVHPGDPIQVRWPALPHRALEPV